MCLVGFNIKQSCLEQIPVDEPAFICKGREGRTTCAAFKFLTAVQFSIGDASSVMTLFFNGASSGIAFTWHWGLQMTSGLRGCWMVGADQDLALLQRWPCVLLQVGFEVVWVLMQKGRMGHGGLHFLCCHVGQPQRLCGLFIIPLQIYCPTVVLGLPVWKPVMPAHALIHRVY